MILGSQVRKPKSNQRPLQKPAQYRKIISLSVFLPHSENYFVNNEPIADYTFLTYTLTVFLLTEFAARGWQAVIDYLY